MFISLEAGWQLCLSSWRDKDPLFIGWMNSCTKLNCTRLIGTISIFGRIIYFWIDVYGKYFGRLVVIFFDRLVIFLDECV
ncbi:hypothetical protein ACSBR2_043086 [Camellia fascicularis]